jgi:hypothetical protein
MFLMLRQEQNMILVWVNRYELATGELWKPVTVTVACLPNRQLILGENISYIRKYNFCDRGGQEEPHSPSLLAEPHSPSLLAEPHSPSLLVEPCTRVGGEK